jgi:hypothetical protein
MGSFNYTFVGGGLSSEKPSNTTQLTVYGVGPAPNPTHIIAQSGYDCNTLVMLSFAQTK